MIHANFSLLVFNSHCSMTCTTTATHITHNTRWQFMNTLTRRRQPFLPLPNRFAIPCSASAAGSPPENDLDDRTNSIYSRFSAAGIVDNRRLLGKLMVVNDQTGNDLPIVHSATLPPYGNIQDLFMIIIPEKRKPRAWN